MSGDEFDRVEGFPSSVRLRASEAVSAVVSDDHNFERGVESARAIAHAVLAESGTDGLTEMVVELTLSLAEAIERIATDGGVPAADLADVWFVE
jgi:hypothetical protein